MLNIKETKLFKIGLCVALTATMLVCCISTTTFASSTTNGQNERTNNENIISHNEEWLTPQQHVDCTVYNLGDGFTATVTTISDYGMGRSTGTKTDTQEIEIKNGSIIAGTVKVTGTFSFDGSTATVTSSNQSRTVKSGYTETGWRTSKSNSGTFTSAYVSATLTVKSGSKEFTQTAKVTCGKNG